MTMSVFAFVATLSFATAFVATAPPMQQPSERHNVFYLPRGGRQSTPVTTRNMIFLSDELTEVVVTARSEFFLWFFGASGSAGIARGQFPKMYKQVQEIRNLKGMGPTLGGETIGLSPLCGYPEDLAIADVEQVINNPLSIQDIVRKYPNDGSFLAQKGYLTFMAFEAANKKSNPLAIRAVFDTFSQSTDTCTPEVAEKKLEEYREDVKRLNGALLASKASGWLSVATLLFLLGLADIVAAGHAYNGWFPDWPGGRNFPLSLLDLDGAPWDIPKYWL
jgi:hypothetical protein